MNYNNLWSSPQSVATIESESKYSCIFQKRHQSGTKNVITVCIIYHRNLFGAESVVFELEHPILSL